MGHSKTNSRSTYPKVKDHFLQMQQVTITFSDVKRAGDCEQMKVILTGLTSTRYLRG